MVSITSMNIIVMRPPKEGAMKAYRVDNLDSVDGDTVLNSSLQLTFTEADNKQGIVLEISSTHPTNNFVHDLSRVRNRIIREIHDLGIYAYPHEPYRRAALAVALRLLKGWVEDGEEHYKNGSSHH